MRQAYAHMRVSVRYLYSDNGILVMLPSIHAFTSVDKINERQYEELQNLILRMNRDHCQWLSVFRKKYELVSDLSSFCSFKDRCHLVCLNEDVFHQLKFEQAN